MKLLELPSFINQSTFLIENLMNKFSRTITITNLNTHTHVKFTRKRRNKNDHNGNWINKIATQIFLAKNPSVPHTFSFVKKKKRIGNFHSQSE